MNKPSSTITAASIAGMVMTVIWGAVRTFTDIVPDPTLVSGSVTLAMALVGYFKKENVLPLVK
jgi:hypothetical protein